MNYVPTTAPRFMNRFIFIITGWPLLWYLGVEQFVMPLFVAVELALVGMRGGLQRPKGPTFWSLALAIWWVPSIVWVPKDQTSIFMKELATAWTQFGVLYLFSINESAAMRHQLSGVLRRVSLYTSAAALIYVFGVWQGSFVSPIGRLLGSAASNSAFFETISLRSFGATGPTNAESLRFRGFSLSFSSLSMLCLVVLPLSFHLAPTKGRRLIGITLFTGTLMALIASQSRLGLLALGFGLTAWPLFLLISKPRTRSLGIGLTLGVALSLLSLAFLAQDQLLRLTSDAIRGFRPGSYLVRSRIYSETLRLLPEHLFLGWGIPVRLVGTRNTFAAGSHSSFLGMLFLHGVPGLILYLSLLASIWRRLFAAGRNEMNQKVASALAVSLLAFHVRELGDVWWWDMTLDVAVWSVWGLIMTMSAERAGLNKEEPRAPS